MRPAPFNQRGTVRGWLEPAEDRTYLEQLLRTAPNAILAGEYELKVHADLSQSVDAPQKEKRVTELLQQLYQGTIKRYVIQVETSRGPRILKFSEATTIPRRLGGLLGISVGRTEHQNHVRAEKLGIAAAHSCGYLELREGPLLTRSLQVQSLLNPELPILDDFITDQYGRFGAPALKPLAVALNHSHAKGFFHADLKGFHAQIAHQGLAPDEPTRYTLLWLDLGRASFALTERQRVINLYQMLRFVVPPQGQARDTFMRSYCEESGWYRDNPNRGMKIVGQLLEQKLRQNPLETV